MYMLICKVMNKHVEFYLVFLWQTKSLVYDAVLIFIFVEGEWWSSLNWEWSEDECLG